ncbi:MAG TPA: Asp-tRNA(Asn)/Glu-tRNA(Gln) amidotransferase subunit GatB [Candidatus Saccharimonadales bacterium]|jgi:aspartyl-tRNA(Asn)/glutamyl-tRNA(Gln) amidotransferase subunit B
MIAKEIRDQYQATIGIECHVQLKTKTKLFSAVDNDAREAPANTLVNHIDFGLPGALPVLNEEALHLAMRAAFALGSEPQKFSKFDRKHYFYPDLPLGYQITQFDEPIILGGSVVIEVDGEQKTIGITRAHMEADAGKSTHSAGKDYSLVDLNRAGTPLLEIVSEPDMHTSSEAKAYARELYLRMRYAGVSDCNLYYGNMRFDVNVSVSKTDELGARTETKNINSFRAVEKTVEYEISRQIEQLEKGEKIVQETRGWDDAKQKTFTQRIKENADDYRYMPDPDLPPVVLDDSYIEKVRAEMSAMPAEWRERLSKLGLDRSQTDTLLEAELDAPEVNYLELIEKNMADEAFAKQLANWFVNIEIPERRDEKVLNDGDNTERLAFYTSVYDLSKANKLSSTNARSLIIDVLAAHNYPENVAEHAEQQGFIQVSDEAEIAKIVEQVLAENAKAAEDVKNGETKATQFLVGQVMKASRGKANPQLAQEFIRKELGL